MRCGPLLKKQKKIKQKDKARDRQGHIWIWIGKKPDTHLHLAHQVGKKTQKNADKLIGKIKSKEAEKGESLFTSDGNKQYTKALLKYYKPEEIKYGQIVRKKDKRGRLIKIIRKVIFGKIDDVRIIDM